MSDKLRQAFSIQEQTMSETTKFEYEKVFIAVPKDYSKMGGITCWYREEWDMIMIESALLAMFEQIRLGFQQLSNVITHSEKY